MKNLSCKKKASRSRPSLDVTVKGARLTFSLRTYIMGVLNVTPDSFSDGGKYYDSEKAVERAFGMVREGADIIDVGGESTRPGATDISDDEEVRRVTTVLKAIADKVSVPISIDTRKPAVAQAAIMEGASIINDVSGLRHDPMMAKVAARHGVAIILMHMKGNPQDMQERPIYCDVVKEIIRSLKESIRIACQAGVKKDKIIIDPGIGFGKTVEHNLEILSRLAEFKALGFPVCVGASRKSFIGKILNKENPMDRLAGTIAASTIAVMNGANLLRVHDVSEAREAAAIADSVLRTKVI